MSNQNGSFEMRPEMFKARLCDLENASAIMLVFENNNIDTTVPRPRPLNSSPATVSNCEKSARGEKTQHRVWLPFRPILASLVGAAQFAVASCGVASFWRRRRQYEVNAMRSAAFRQAARWQTATPAKSFHMSQITLLFGFIYGQRVLQTLDTFLIFFPRTSCFDIY